MTNSVSLAHDPHRVHEPEKSRPIRFPATTTINRHDFGVSWNDVVDQGGVVVGKLIDITIDAEAILEGEPAS